MRKLRFVLCLAAVVFAFTLAPGILMAGVPSWDSFDEAVFSGITVNAAPDGLSYVLTLSGAPKVTVGGSTYDVNWIQGFFLLDPMGEETMFASQGTSPEGWTYSAKTEPEPYSVVGWSHSAKAGRLLPGGSATFTLGSLSAPAGAVYGFHLGYAMADVTLGVLSVSTDHFKDTPVPEPGSLVVTATVLVGMVSFIRRRRVT